MRHSEHARADAKLEHRRHGSKKGRVARLVRIAGEGQGLAGPTTAEWLRHCCFVFEHECLQKCKQCSEKFLPQKQLLLSQKHFSTHPRVAWQKKRDDMELASSKALAITRRLVYQFLSLYASLRRPLEHHDKTYTSTSTYPPAPSSRTRLRRVSGRARTPTGQMYPPYSRHTV